MHIICIVQQHDNNSKFMDLRDCKYLFASIITKLNSWRPNGPSSNGANKILLDVYRYDNTYARVHRVAACPPTRDLSGAKRDVSDDEFASRKLRDTAPRRGSSRNRYHVCLCIGIIDM